MSHYKTWVSLSQPSDCEKKVESFINGMIQHLQARK